MHYIIYLFFISLLSLDLFASTLTLQEKEWLKNHPTITLGSDKNWSPYIIQNDNGSISGFDADILNLVNKKMGTNFKLQIGIWKDILEKAKNKDIDGLSTSAIHKEREKYFNFSKIYVSANRVLITSNLNPKNINSVKDLNGKKIAYQDSNLFDKKLASQFPDSILVPEKSYEEILKDLIKGKVDAVLGSYSFIYTAQELNLPYIKIVDEIPNSRLELVFSIRKDYPEALSILNKGLDAISKEEKIQLKNKWFLDSYTRVVNFDLTDIEKAYLKNNFPLRVQGLDSFPPFNFVKNGESQGYSVDYIKLLGKYLNTEVEFVNDKSWAQSLKMLKNGELDIIPQIAKNKERAEYLDFTNIKHIDHIIGLAIRKNSNIASLKDLEGKIIAVMDKTFLHTHLAKNFPNLILYPVATTKKSLEALSLGQVDAAIGNIPTFNYHIQENWLSNITTINIQDYGAPTKLPLFMGVAKGNYTLKSILDKAHNIIPTNEIIKLKEKWMNVNKTPKLLNFTEEEKAYLNGKKTISMCIDPNWMPIEKNENGQHIGISADYIKIMSKKINTPISMVPTKTWLESLEFAKQRKCDIFSLVTPTPERKKYILFSKPYIYLPLVLATNIEQPFINDISSIANKKIGTVKGYSYSELLKNKYPNMKFIEVENDNIGLEKVSKGELFGFIGTLTTLGYNIQKKYISKLKIAGKFNETWDLGIGIRNDEPILKSIFNKVIDDINPQEHQKILNKWISINIKEDIDYEKIIYISLFFALIILIFVYKNHSISQINKKLTKAHEEIQDQQKMVDKYVLIIETDVAGKVTKVNEAFCKTLEYESKELIGKPYLLLQDTVSDSALNEMLQNVRKDRAWSGEITNHTKRGETKNFFMNINPIYQNNTKIGYRAILEDITDKKKIEKLSITDKLTDIFNRLKLDELIIEQMETCYRYKLPFSIILVDIDDFKMVNDTYGHDIGDDVLRKLSSIFKQNTRSTDIVGRWGGEEFLIICPNTIAKNAHIVAEHIRFFIEQENFDKAGSLTVSMGITEYKNKESEVSLFKRADNALYKAKHNGKNQSVVL